MRQDRSERDRRAFARAVEAVDRHLRELGWPSLSGQHLDARIRNHLAEEAQERHLSPEAVLRRFFDPEAFARGEIDWATSL